MGVKDLVVFDVIDSTNDWALEQCRYGDGLPRACLAEKQLKGRGRNQRNWYSPSAQNIYMSFVREFDREAGQLSGLSLVIGICIVRVLGRLGVKSGLKWPNDVYTDSGKIAGVLVETRFKTGSNPCVVVGVGLNYSMELDQGSEIDIDWTDILRELDGQCAYDRSEVAGQLLNEIVMACEQFETVGLNVFIEEWKKYDLCAGKVLNVHDRDSVIQGEYMGINEQGALMLNVAGKSQVFYAADVSIRMKQ